MQVIHSPLWDRDDDPEPEPGDDHSCEACSCKYAIAVHIGKGMRRLCGGCYRRMLEERRARKRERIAATRSN